MKRAVLAAGVTLLVFGSQALASDLPFPPPMPEPILPPVESSNGGWYLRGDVGVGMESYDGFEFDVLDAGALDGYSLIQKSMNDKTIIGTGLGFQWNDFLRFDVTGEYRAANNWGFTLASPPVVGGLLDGLQGFNVYSANHAAAVGLVNAYYDIGDFWGLMPFIGGGAGFAYHRVTGFHDLGTGINCDASGCGFGIAEPVSNTTFAWAVHAGMDYEVNQNLKLEMSYRYLDEGNANAGTVLCLNTAFCGDVNYTIREITSHDMRIGMRWTFGGPEAPLPQPEEPVIRRY